MIVTPLLLQIIVVPYNCKYYTAALSDLISLHCFRNVHTIVVNSILSHTTAIFYPLLSFYLINWSPTSSLLSRSNSQSFPLLKKCLISFSPFLKSGYLGEISWLTLYLSKVFPISSLWVGTLNTHGIHSHCFKSLAFPLQLNTNKQWEDKETLPKWKERGKPQKEC